MDSIYSPTSAASSPRTPKVPLPPPYARRVGIIARTIIVRSNSWPNLEAPGVNLGRFPPNNAHPESPPNNNYPISVFSFPKEGDFADGVELEKVPRSLSLSNIVQSSVTSRRNSESKDPS